MSEGDLEFDTDAGTEVRHLADHIELQGIYMHSSHAERGPGSLEGPAQLETRARVDWDWVDVAQLVYLVGLSFEVLDGDKVPRLSGSVEYIVGYNLTDEYKPSPQELADFSLHGVAFQAHPYLREHVASTCVRSGLAPAMLPILLREDVERDYDLEGD